MTNRTNPVTNSFIQAKAASRLGLIQVLDVMQSQSRTIGPIYGWGWRQDDHWIEVPDQFVLDLTEDGDIVFVGVMGLT